MSKTYRNNSKYEKNRKHTDFKKKHRKFNGINPKIEDDIPIEELPLEEPLTNDDKYNLDDLGVKL